MKKLVLFLVLCVLLVLTLTICLLVQHEESETKIQKKDSVGSHKSNHKSVKSNPTLPGSKNLESTIPLEGNKSDSHLNKRESFRTTSSTSSKIILEDEPTIDTKSIEIEVPHKQNTSNIEEKAVKTQTSPSNQKSTKLSPDLDGQEKLTLNFEFIDEVTNTKPNKITVMAPIKSHIGSIGEYPYTAKLENDQITITWETPKWFPHSNVFYVDSNIKVTFNSLILSNVSKSRKKFSIDLYKIVLIELAFETTDGVLIPDDTKIRFSEKPPFVENYTPLIKNQKGVIYIEPGKVIEIKSLSVGQYFSDSFFVDSKTENNITRKILLKKKIAFTAVLVDQKQQPLKDYFVIISKAYYFYELDKILKEYEKNGVVDESNNEDVYRSNVKGEILGEASATGECIATIFGPKIKKSIQKSINIPKDGEKIMIQIDLSNAEIKLNFLDNGKLYTNELEVTYRNNLAYEYLTIKEGVLILSKLQAGKLELHIKSKTFVNTTVQLTVPETGSIEQNVELKQGAVLSGTLTSNHKPILGKNITIYLYEKGNSGYDHSTQTDVNGHFQFTGLNPELIYIFHIDQPNYTYDPSAPKEFRTNDGEVTINVLERFDLVGSVFDEAGKPIEIQNFSHSVLRNETLAFGLSPRKEKNKFSVGLELGDKISFCVVAKDFAIYYQTIVFEQSHLSNPLVINLKKGITVKGTAVDANNKPIFSGIIISSAIFYNNFLYANHVEAYRQEQTALGDNGTFQIDNVQMGEKFYLLSKDNSPIPFTIEEKHRQESIELKGTKSYSFSGNLRTQNNVFQTGRRVMGERAESNERVITMVDDKGNFHLNCLRPGKWVFTSNFRDMYKVVPKIEIEIIDKDETYDWVVFR